MRTWPEEDVGLMQRPSGDGFPPVRSLFTALPPAGERGVFGNTRRHVSHFPSALEYPPAREREEDAFGPSRRSRRNSLFRQCPYTEPAEPQGLSSPSGGVVSRSLSLARHALSAVPMMTSLFKKVVSSSQEPVMETKPPAVESVQFSAESRGRRDSSPSRDDFRLAADPLLTFDKATPLNSSLLRRPTQQTESPIQQKLCSPPPSRQLSPPPTRERPTSSVRETSARGQAKPMTSSRRNVVTVLKSIEKEYKDHLTLADFRTFQNRRRGILGNELKRLIKAQELAVTSRCIDYEQSERASAADEADTRAFNQVNPNLVEGLPPVLDLGSESEAEEDPPAASNEEQTEAPSPRQPRPAAAAPPEEKKMRRIEAPPAAPPPTEAPRSRKPEEPAKPPPDITVPAPEPAAPPVPTPTLFVSPAPAPKPVAPEVIPPVEPPKTPEAPPAPAKAPETPTVELPTPTPLFGSSLTSEPAPSVGEQTAPEPTTSLFGGDAAKPSAPFTSSLFGGAIAKPATEEPKTSPAVTPNEPARDPPVSKEPEGTATSTKSLFGTSNTSSSFGGVAATESKPAATAGSGFPSSLFESSTPKPSSTTAAPSAFPMSGSASNAPESKSLFGGASFPAASNQTSLFGNLSSSGTPNVASSLFGEQAKPSGSLFGLKPSAPEATSPAPIFGTPAATAKPTDTVASLFGNQQSVTSPPASSSLFGQSATTNTPLFGAASNDRPSPTGSLFGSAVSHVPSTAVGSQSLFGTQPPTSSIFSQPPQQNGSSAFQFGTGLPSSPFGGVSQSSLSPNMPQAAPLFGNASPSPVPAFGTTSSMFAAGTPQPAFNQSPFPNSQPQPESQDNPFVQAVRYKIRRKRNT